MKPSIAVIIPSLNSPIIDQVLEAVLNQEGIQQISGIWVVGRDESELVPAHPQIHFLDTGHPIPSGTARNLGIAHALADLLIFLDSDCIPQPGWLVEHLRAQAAGYSIVGGGVQPHGTSYWQLVYNLTLFHEFLSTSKAGKRQFLPTLNLSVQAQVIEKIGNLEETLSRGHDVDWTTRMWQAGFQPFFQPAAAVNHQHNRSTLRKVWLDCAHSGYYMRQIRLNYANSLQTPALLRYPRLVWWLSPLIAAWATLRIISHIPAVIARYWYTIPAIYLTKIAWCWGASRDQEPG